MHPRHTALPTPLLPPPGLERKTLSQGQGLRKACLTRCYTCAVIAEEEGSRMQYEGGARGPRCKCTSKRSPKRPPHSRLGVHFGKCANTRTQPSRSATRAVRLGSHLRQGKQQPAWTEVEHTSKPESLEGRRLRVARPPNVQRRKRAGSCPGVQKQDSAEMRVSSSTLGHLRARKGVDCEEKYACIPNHTHPQLEQGLTTYLNSDPQPLGS